MPSLCYRCDISPDNIKVVLQALLNPQAYF